MGALLKSAAWLGAAALAAVHLAGAVAQAPDFSGTWKLDASRSRIAESVGLAGLIGAGAPDTLHVTQPANGTLIVESQVNESHARIYRPGGTTQTPVFVGQSGVMTMASRWEGRALVAEGRHQSASGVSTPVKERFGLDSDGRTLTIEVTIGGPDAAASNRLAYTRTSDVGPCESWPTPCKRFPQ